jgi:molybdate transport system substrate-binding protein
MSRPSRIALIWLSTATAVAACAGSSTSGHTPPSPTPSGSLTVFAASSLTAALGAERTALATTAPRLRLTYQFAGSQTLVAQIMQGAPADVVACADTVTMQKLVGAGLVEAPTTFARNKLEILVAPGNPEHVTGLTDLARSDLIVVLEDPTVPAGAYAKQALSRLGVTVHPKSLELDVKSAVAKVTSGEADATVVYVSDVRGAGSRATGVSIPEDQNVVATYPIAVLKASRNHAAAEAFVNEMIAGSGQRALAEAGFLPPT